MSVVDRIRDPWGFGDYSAPHPDDLALDAAHEARERSGVVGLASTLRFGGRAPLELITPKSIRPPVGVEVRWVEGALTRGAAVLDPEGIGDHWTAAKPTVKRPWPSLDICTYGRKKGIGVSAVPGPLINWLISWPDERGVVVIWVVASGRGNHWGACDTNVFRHLGKPMPDRIVPGPDNGGAKGRLLGVEVEQRGNQPYPPKQVEALCWLTSRVCTVYSTPGDVWVPSQRSLSHEEGTRRKIDFTGVETPPFTSPGVARAMFDRYHRALVAGVDDLPIAPRPVVVPPRPTVRYGSSGSTVDELQRLLGLTPNGQFDTATQAKVVAFQAAHGLDADGIVGPKTWAAILRTKGT